MSGIKDQEQIEALRQRLYERGRVPTSFTRPTLSKESPLRPPAPIRTDWNLPVTTQPRTTDFRAAVTDIAAPDSEEDTTAAEARPRRRYRIFIILFSLIVFIIGVGLSSLYLLTGTNQISANNIGFSLTGPTTIGGGETLTLQLGINNQNPVPLESATLIVRFPTGTRSTDDPPRQLFEERVPLETIPSGEIRNLTVPAVVFGEENSEHTIEAILEYRVAGSNSLFERRAEPLTYRISSAPVGLRLMAPPRVAAGQEVPLTLRVTSNAPNRLESVLIRAEYPSAFTFASATPPPVSGQNVWLIEALEPNQTVEIAVRGTLTGFVDDEYQLRFIAGVPRAVGSFELGGELARTSTNVAIEESLITVGVRVGGSNDRPVVLRNAEAQPVSITITNTQQQPLTDVTISAAIRGSMASGLTLASRNGQVNADNQTITWRVVGAGDLVEIQPGQSRTVEFTALPEALPASGSWIVAVEVRSRRDGATAVLVGTAEAEVQYATPIVLAREVTKSTGPFQDTGPVPPRVGEATTYTVSLVAMAGANRLANPVVTTNLPLYVTWLDQTAGPGTVEFTPSNRQLRWVPGDIAGNEQATLSFQVSFTPSAEQERQTPNLIGPSTMQANDAFTGTLERATAAAATTELSTEAGFAPGNGRVER